MMFIFVLAKIVLLCHFILFVFPCQSLVTIAPLKQLIVSLRMEEQFIRNVTQAKYVFISDLLKKLDVGVVIVLWVACVTCALVHCW